MIDIQDIEKRLDELSKKQSNTDKAVNDLLHILEYIDLNAVQLTKLAIKLRSNLRERREAKEEYAPLQSLKTHFQPALKASEKRDKKYRRESRESAYKYGFIKEMA